MKVQASWKLQEAVRQAMTVGAPARRILVGVSGGPDSVALLHLLHDLAARQRWTLGLAHLHHGTRGKDSDNDAAFVKRLGRALGWPVHVRKVSVPERVKRSGASLEMVAREARYAFFDALCRRHRYDVVALAHTQDDQAETVLLRLIRGSGTGGLGGMAVESKTPNGIRLLRPLLNVTKATLLEELQRRGQTFRTDASNADCQFMRNRVRHELIPLLQARFNPSIQKTLAEFATLARAEEQEWELWTQRDQTVCADTRAVDVLRVDALRELTAARRRRVLRHWLYTVLPEAHDVTASLILRAEALAGSTPGTRKLSAGHGWFIVRQYNQLVAQAGDASGATVYRIRLSMPGVTELAAEGLQAHVTRVVGFERRPPLPPGQWPAHAWISRKAVGHAGVYARPWREGDRFYPFGMRGSRKVQDIFTDLKVPVELRHRLPLLVCRDRIVWIPGYTVDRDVAVSSATSPAWHLTICRSMRYGSPSRVRAC